MLPCRNRSRPSGAPSRHDRNELCHRRPPGRHRSCRRASPLRAAAHDRADALRRRRDRRTWRGCSGSLGKGDGDGVGYHWSSLRQLPARDGPPDRVPRRLLRADRGAAPRAAAVPRAHRRLRPAHDLAPLERPRRHLPRARARRLHRLGLCEAGRHHWFTEYWNWLTLPQPQAAARSARTAAERPAVAAQHRHRARPPRRTRGSSPRRSARRSCSCSCSSPRSCRAPQALLRVVVRGPLHRLRRDRARVVPHDPGRQRADRRQASAVRLLASALRRARSRSCSGTGCSGRSGTPSATGCASPR